MTSLMAVFTADSCVELCGLDVRVAEHLRDALDGDTVFEGDGRCEGVPGAVEGNLLVNVAGCMEVLCSS